jgi:hypothetical protein
MMAGYDCGFRNSRLVLLIKRLVPNRKHQRNRFSYPTYAIQLHFVLVLSLPLHSHKHPRLQNMLSFSTAHCKEFLISHLTGQTLPDCHPSLIWSTSFTVSLMSFCHELRRYKCRPEVGQKVGELTL